ncbi:invasion associated locus B family protein [Phyllobacterium lublinensis]|uniref:invasion associated locus B family protein n=1 Tax=Phyllobacterium lublinensis TaxID=2875708 RepID=UPI001CCEF3E2|nr:invasion associated locus B family protein [Phyllobacterium sp. 2063]MBZ9654984.1 invasion associated locus B family protein [Phyllobacterium sp. 2063]
MRTILACLLLSGWLCPPAAGQEPASVPAYSIKPSEVTLPVGAELGRYRRLIHPFENWDLICDENLKTMKKVCNVTQTIVDKDGQLAFSWSLAATEGGKPMMILRTKPGLGVKKPVKLSFPGRTEPVSVETYACDPLVCVALLPVGPILREHIAKTSMVGVSYGAALGELIAFDVPLKGLSAALAAIK